MNELSHFAINADDVPAARAFYEKVFGWRFTAVRAARLLPHPDPVRDGLQRA